MSNNPYDAPPMQPYGNTAFGGDPNLARQKVAGPAISLIIVGVLNALNSFWNVISAALTLASLNPMVAAQQAQFDQMRQQGQSEEMVDMMRTFANLTAGPLGLVIGLLGLACSVVIILGAIKMKNLKSRGFSMTAAIISMIPCLSPCCILGIPFGIWALVAMNDPNVRSQMK